MKLATLRPHAHVHVCTHRRRDDDPLGGGCGERGEAVFAALARERVRRGLLREIWLSGSSCLGQCPKAGCTVAIGTLHLVEVTADDVPAVLDEATR